MTRERFDALVAEELAHGDMLVTDRWRVWTAELWDRRGRGTGEPEMVSPEGDEAGLRALLRVKLAHGLEHEVTGEDILGQVEADPTLAAALEP